MASDISVTINPAAQIGVTIAEGIPKHSATHAPGASDSLSDYYITGSVVRPSETGVFITSGQTGQFVSTDQTGRFVTTGQTGNFVTTSQTGFYTGVFYPYSANPNGYVQGAVVRPSNTGNFVDKTSVQTISNKYFTTTSFVNSANATGIIISGLGAGNYTEDSLIVFKDPLSLEKISYIAGGGSDGHLSLTAPNGSILLNGPVQGLQYAIFNSGVSGNNLVYNVSNQTISGVKNFASRPTVNGTGVLLSGEAADAANTGSLTGAFYPLNSNPSGYITGVDLSSYVTKSSTGAFVTTGQTGQFITASQTGEFVSTGATGGFVTGSVVRPSETGSFIISSQTGQFVSTGSTGVFVTGAVVRPSETGNFITSSQTGVFYPANNPSGFITGVDLSNYVTGSVVRPSETGNFAVNSQVVFITGNQDVSGVKNFYSRPTVNGTGVLLSGEAAGAANTGELTGVFYPLNSNPSGYITGVDLSAYVTGSVVRPSETGSFITTSQTGAFYPSSNPSGFITGVDLSSYVTTGQTGQFVTGSVVRPSETGVFVTSSQTGQFVWTGATGSFLTTGAADGRYVSLTGNQDISGLKDFQTRPTVTDIPVLISGDPVDLIHLYGKNEEAFSINKGQPVYIGGSNGSNPLIKLASNSGESTSSKTIGLLAQNLNSNDFGYVVTEGVLEGFDTSAATAGDPMWLGPTGNILFGTGNKPYGNNHLVYLGIVLRSQLNNGKVYVKVQNGFEINELHRVYAQNPNNKDTLIYDSGSGSWFSRQISTGDVSGISAYALAANTGSFITTGQTGQFVGTGSTGNFVVSSATGAFLTTGAADGRYYSLSNGESISGFATTGFNDAVTGMSITGDTTKFITLFQRDGTTITGSFTDNAGTGGSSPASLSGNNYNVYATGSYTASFGEKILANTSSTGFTITMPSSPVTGGTVFFADFAGTWATNNLTISGNGSRIFSDTGNLICNSSGASFFLVYINTEIGYNLYYG